MRDRFLWHARWSLVTCGAFAVVIVSTLTARVPDILETPIATPEPSWSSQAMPLLETGGPPVYVLFLRIEDPVALLSHPEIRILFATYGTRVQVTSATLEVAGTSCTYEASPGSRLVNNEMLGFFRQPVCNPMRVVPSGDLKISVHLGRRDPLAAWTYQPSPDAANPSANGIRVIKIPARVGPPPVVIGRYVDYLAPTGTRRIDLLAYMWQISGTTRWIWIALALAIALLWGGTLLTPHGPLTESASRWGFAARAAVGTGCAAAALGMCYAVLVPPFHAPDESHHFLGFAKIAQRPEIADEATRWSSLGHFARLQFHSDERFRPRHIGHPWSMPWDDAITENLMSRSSTGNRLWLLVAPHLRQSSTQATLLSLRLINVGLFALAVALGTAIVTWLIDAPFPQLAAFTFLFVPTTPFFAMHVSNYAPLTAAYVLFAFGVMASVLGGRRGHYGGLVLGLGTALIFTTSRSALPMAVMLSVVLATRLILGSPGVSTMMAGIRAALVFWSGFGAGLLTARLFLDPEYESYVVNIARPYLRGMLRTQDWPLNYFWWILVVLLIFALVLDVVMFWIRRLVAGRIASVIARLVRPTGVFAAIAIMGLMLTSLFVRFPAVQNIDPANRPRVSDYVAQVTLSALGSFRLRYPDFLLSTSFWAGFGWLDTIPPDWFIVLLTTLTGAALTALLLRIAGRHDARGLAWLIALFAGFTLTLVLYAIVTLKIVPALHGRYLLGLYLTVLPVCWSLPVVAEPVRGRTAWIPRVPALLTVSQAIHVYSLCFILSRFF